MTTTATTEIEYTYLDADRAEQTGIYIGDREAAIDAAVSHLSAECHGDVYRYFAYETCETYEVTADALAELGAGLLEQPRGDCYSLWAAGAGTLVSPAD